MLLAVAGPLRAVSEPALPPLPFGSAVTPDLTRLFISHVASANVSVVDTDPASPDFLREIALIPVGLQPLGVAVTLDGRDVAVANSGDDTVSLIDVASLTVRKTLRSPLLSRPVDIVFGPTETPFGPAFGSGTHHGYIANSGRASVLVYESGPAGPQGIGFDAIIGEVRAGPDVAPAGQAGAVPLLEPQAVAFDPLAPLDAFSLTVGCFVAHHDEAGHGVASRVTYTHDGMPGVNPVDTTTTLPSFRRKRFEVTQQFVSTHVGAGLDVALADENFSVAQPTRAYLLMTGGVLDAFSLQTGAFVARYQLAAGVTDLNPLLQP